MPISERMIAYISPATRHNVTDTGIETLEYVYVVAPAADKQLIAPMHAAAVTSAAERNRPGPSCVWHLLLGVAARH